MCLLGIWVCPDIEGLHRANTLGHKIWKSHLCWHYLGIKSILLVNMVHWKAEFILHWSKCFLEYYWMIDLVECLRKLKKNSIHRFSLFKGRFRSLTNIYLLLYFPVYFICNCQGELWWQGWFKTCYVSWIRFLWYPLGIGRTINVSYIYVYIYYIILDGSLSNIDYIGRRKLYWTRRSRY